VALDTLTPLEDWHPPRNVVETIPQLIRRTFMKVLNPPKASFGKAKYSPVRNVTCLEWEDAVAVEFDDGLSFLEPHATIRKANKTTPEAVIGRVELDKASRRGFFVHYDNGQVAEVSRAFVREFSPKHRPHCK
jgi:hypothetical protein